MFDFLLRIAYSIMRCTLGGIILIGLLFLAVVIITIIVGIFADSWIPLLLAIAVMFPFILVTYILKKDNRQN